MQVIFAGLNSVLKVFCETLLGQIFSPFIKKLIKALKSPVGKTLIAVCLVGLVVTLCFISCIPSVTLNEIAVGQYVTFGKYPQSSNYPDAIRWQVYRVNEDQLVLFSDLVLDVSSFGPTAKWETSDARYWLNSTFFINAFSPEERNALCVDSMGDKVTLPEESIIKAIQNRNGYLSVASQYTEYAYEQGGEAVQGKAYYLTKSEQDETEVIVVQENGHTTSTYSNLISGVRPMIAIWMREIRLNSGEGTQTNPYQLTTLTTN